MLLGFLFAMTLLLLVAGCVSPSTFRLIVAILTVVNMAWVADLAIFSEVAAWLMRSVSSVNLHSLLEEDPSHTVSLSNYQEDESTLRESLENLGRPSWPLSFGRETPAHDVGHGGHDSHLSSAWCCWRVAGKVIQHPLGFRQLWNKTGVEHFLRDLSRVFMAVGDANIALHPHSSVTSLSSTRV